MPKQPHQLLRGQDDGADVHQIRDDEHGDEQALRRREQAVELDRRAIAHLHAMPQPHAIDREDARFDPGENERHQRGSR